MKVPKKQSITAITDHKVVGKISNNAHDKKKYSQSLKRSLSRLIAVQALYQYDFYERNISIVEMTKQMTDNYFLSDKEELATSYQDKIDNNLLETLTSGVILVLPNLDSEIKLWLKNEWKIENLLDVMLAILRLATFELNFIKDTPKTVIISEYVDLAACFYDIKQVTFVNSILQNITNKAGEHVAS